MNKKRTYPLFKWFFLLKVWNSFNFSPAFCYFLVNPRHCCNFLYISLRHLSYDFNLSLILRFLATSTHQNLGLKCLLVWLLHLNNLPKVWADHLLTRVDQGWCKLVALLHHLLILPFLLLHLLHLKVLHRAVLLHFESRHIII